MMDSYAGTPFQELQLITDHVQVEVLAPNGETIIVDEALGPLLVRLWELGYDTLFSCQGGVSEATPEDDHEAGLRFNGYIYFKLKEMAESFYEIVDAHFPVAEYPVYEIRANDVDTVRFRHEAIVLFEKAFS